jgi:hypothetical protein
MSEPGANDLIKSIVGYAYPTAEPVGLDGRRFVRRWVVRCQREVPEQRELSDLAAHLMARAKKSVRDAYAAHTPDEQISGSLPGASMIRIGSKHCVVVIETPSAPYAVGDAAGIGTWTILRGIDDTLGIEDLEGLPKQLWFQLM